MKRIITVSREFGSGGHAVAQIMGELLGVPVYDKEIIEQSAEESGLSRIYPYVMLLKILKFLNIRK